MNGFLYLFTILMFQYAYIVKAFSVTRLLNEKKVMFELIDSLILGPVNTKHTLDDSKCSL